MISMTSSQVLVPQYVNQELPEPVKLRYLAVVLAFACAIGSSGCTELSTQPSPNADPITSDNEPSWSPDGKWIAYRHTNIDLADTTYPTGLYVVDTSGNNRRLVIAGPALGPTWSPDNLWIAFSAGAILKIMPDGQGLTSVFSLSNAYFPNWSPDGRMIAFDTDYRDPHGANEIWVINSDGSGLKDLSQHGTGEWRQPAWSPDGSQLVHLRYIGIGTEEVFIMDTLGMNAKRLTFNSEVDRDPHWSPDGMLFAWTHCVNGAKIYLMNSDGTSQRMLVEGSFPSWSPDSKQVVFSRLSRSGDRITLWSINIDGTSLRPVTF